MQHGRRISRANRGDKLLERGRAIFVGAGECHDLAANRREGTRAERAPEKRNRRRRADENHLAIVGELRHRHLRHIGDALDHWPSMAALHASEGEGREEFCAGLRRNPCRRLKGSAFRRVRPKHQRRACAGLEQPRRPLDPRGI